MKISIIIPAFNEERLLGESLQEIRRAMAAFAERGWETELIVCDNNSTDRTAEIARAAGAQVVFEPVNQIARARNAGAAVATGDWLVFVDADSHPSRELFADVADQINAGHCLAGGSTMRLETGNFAARLVTGIWNRASRLKRMMAGSFIFVEVTAFREIGGFSNELFAGEELDLSVRLHALAKRRGRRIIILWTVHETVNAGSELNLRIVVRHPPRGVTFAVQRGRAEGRRGELGDAHRDAVVGRVLHTDLERQAVDRTDRA